MHISLTDTNFKQEVLESTVPVLVDFWADWCVPCHMLAPAVEEVANKYRGSLKVCKLNVDEGPRTSSQYGVMSIPMLALFKEGRLIDKIVGVVPAPEIENTIKPHV